MNLATHKLSLRQFGFLILLTLIPSVGMAASRVLIDGKTQLRVTDDPVQRRCVVVATSGSYETDRLACNRALVTMSPIAVGIPEGTYLFPGRDRGYANGTCAYPNGEVPTTAEKAACAQVLTSMGKARVTMAVDPGSWVQPTDFEGVEGNRGIIRVSIGVSTSGRASYCVVVQSSENTSLDSLVCQAILQRARFDPAVDKDGQPIPSSYDRRWTF